MPTEGLVGMVREDGAENEAVESSPESQQRCREVLQLFVDDASIWPTYCAVADGVRGIDVDANFTSEPVRAYIEFVGNIVRERLRREEPDIESDRHCFDVFHDLIFEEANRRSLGG